MRLNTENKTKEEELKQCAAGVAGIELSSGRADMFLLSGKIRKSWRRFCADRSDLSDKCAVVEVQLRASSAVCRDLCEMEPDFQQVLQREQGSEGHSGLPHTPCQLKFTHTQGSATDFCMTERQFCLHVM